MSERSCAVAAVQPLADRSTLPSVSFVINNHNYGRYLSKCIDSALGQSHPVEVVVVDDGSSDESPRILDHYSGAATIVRQENRGQGAAVNRGVLASTGEIVCLLDSDDWSRNDRSRTVAQHFQAGPGIDWLIHDMSLVDAAGMPLADSLYTFAAPATPVRDLVTLGDTPGSTSGLCFRRQLLQRIGDIPENVFSASADGYLICSAAFLGRLDTLQIPLSIRRLHASSVTAPSWRNASQSIRRIRMKHEISERVAELAAQLPEPDADIARAAARGTWWQAKADLQHLKTGPEQSVASLASAWLRFAGAVGATSMPAARKAGFIVRDGFLTALPGAAFARAWWMLHYGRPRLRISR